MGGKVVTVGEWGLYAGAVWGGKRVPVNECYRSFLEIWVPGEGVRSREAKGSGSYYQDGGGNGSRWGRGVGRPRHDGCDGEDTRKILHSLKLNR